MNPEDLLLTPAEVAKILRISPVAVRVLCACEPPELEHSRVGKHKGRIVIPRSAVAEYLERQKVRRPESRQPMNRKLEILKA
jgi:hypothetical protein